MFLSFLLQASTLQVAGAPFQAPSHGKVHRGSRPTVRNWPEEHAYKNMDPGWAEAQYGASFCIKHRKNIDPHMENSRTLTLTWSTHDSSWVLMMNHEYSWCIMSTHDASWELMMHHEYSWCIMNTHDASWVLMMHHEYSWCIMNTLDVLWGLMMHHEYSWCFMSTYGALVLVFGKLPVLTQHWDNGQGADPVNQQIAGYMGGGGEVDFVYTRWPLIIIK